MSQQTSESDEEAAGAVDGSPPGGPRRIAVVDPYLFLGVKGLLPLPQPEIDDLVYNLLHKQGFLIATQDGLWEDIKRDFIRPAFKQRAADRTGSGLDRHRFQTAVDRLLKTPQTVFLPHPPGPDEVVLEPAAEKLFPDLPAAWQQRLKRLLCSCAHARRGGDDVVLFTRLVRDRNARAQPENLKNKALFIMKEPWLVTARLPDGAMVEIDLICNSRNYLVRWTCRHADELPDHSDGGKFPFYPKEGWRSAAVKVVRTKTSQDAWIDRGGNGWSEPAARSQPDAPVKHFDVNFDNQVKKDRRLTVPYLNIRRWLPADRRPADSRRPGDIDHVRSEYANQEKYLLAHPGWRR